MVLLTIGFIACTKTQDESGKEKEQSAKFRQSQMLSRQHDSILLLVRSTEAEMINNHAISGSSELKFEEAFEVLEKVTGYRPVKLNENRAREFFKTNSEPEHLTINLDNRELELSDFANSEIQIHYLELADKIIKDSLIEVPEKLLKISALQKDFLNDALVDQKDIPAFLNVTEILKGSLTLWKSEMGVPASVNGKFLIKPIEDWSFWKKLAFVSAADALGGILGTFVGGIIMINGVPMYIPAGPQGTVVGAVTLSYVASKMAGW